MASNPDDGTSPASVTSADVLPPVEPPSAGFLIQLFVIPGLIVVVIVLVSLMFNWLAHLGADPEAYLRDIERGRINGWQAAHNFAVELTRNAQLRENRAIAARMNDILAARLESPFPTESRLRDAHVNLLMYLSQALGNFSVAEGLPALQQAASLDQEDEDALRVRCVALSAIAMLLDKDPQISTGQQQAEQTLLAASREEHHVIRERAAYALGILGGDAARERLEVLLNDGYPNVRYNAATSLARLGETSCVEVLAEMLDPAETAGAALEERAEYREGKQVLVLDSALEAAIQLAESHPDAELAGLNASVRDLLDAVQAGRVPAGSKQTLEFKARRLQDLLQRRAADQPASAAP